jgi:transposase
VLPTREAGIAPCTDIIDAWMQGDESVPRNQRHTARRIWQRRRRTQRQPERGDGVALCADLAGGTRAAGVEVVVPQTHEHGEEAEVDFCEFYAAIAGVSTKCHLFVLRLSASGKAVRVAFTSQGPEAFLEGHVRAFAQLGGVPGRIRYDNLKAAVARVLEGRGREGNRALH